MMLERQREGIAKEKAEGNIGEEGIAGLTQFFGAATHR
jgi:hypothetical protein